MIVRTNRDKSEGRLEISLDQLCILFLPLRRVEVQTGRSRKRWSRSALEFRRLLNGPQVQTNREFFSNPWSHQPLSLVLNQEVRCSMLSVMGR